MATKRVTITTTTCDFCGRDTTKDSKYETHATLRIESSNCEGGCTWDSTDMCHECLVAFEKWCQERKKTNET